MVVNSKKWEIIDFLIYIIKRKNFDKKCTYVRKKCVCRRQTGD